MKRLIIIITIMIGFSALSSYAGGVTASWYSTESCIREGSNGHYAANGERFLEDELTCASWFYPFGTTLKVTNLKNKKFVYVVVTDRGPSRELVSKGRVIDLAKYPFSVIAPLSDGVIPVHVEVDRR